MMSKLKQFQQLKNKDLDTILRRMHLSEDALYDLMNLWIKQGCISEDLPSYNRLVKRRKQKFHQKRVDRREQELKSYYELRKEGYNDNSIHKMLNKSFDTLRLMYEKCCLRMYKAGKNKAEIADSLNTNLKEVALIIDDYELQKQLKEARRRRKIVENRRYAENHLEKMQQNERYLVFDIEANQNPDELIEIAMIDIAGNEVYNTLIKPTKRIGWHITALTGITNTMVSHQPGIHQVMKELSEITRNKVLLSWGNDYDLRLLQKSAKVTGINLHCQFGCAQRIHMGITGSTNQIALHKACFQEEQGHRALEDCHMVLNVLQNDMSLLQNANNQKILAPVEFTPAEAGSYQMY